MVIRRSSSIFVNYEDKILLLLRDDNEKIIDPGVWAPVSGTIEVEENAEECVQREVLEELELELNPSVVRNIGLEKRPDSVNYFFLATIQKENIDRILIKEGQDMKFVAIDEARTGKIFSKKLGEYRNIALNIQETGILEVLEQEITRQI